MVPNAVQAWGGEGQINGGLSEEVTNWEGLEEGCSRETYPQVQRS